VPFGQKLLPYGLDRLPSIRKAGWVVALEGESDPWTGWYYDLPVIGIPGAGSWRPEWADYFKGLTTYI
jgi:hypothetical protein